MALLHFEGFDTYGAIPGTTNSTAVSCDVPLQAAGYYGTGTDDSYGASYDQIGRPRSSFDPNMNDRACYYPLNNAGFPSRAYFQPRSTLARKIETTGDQIVIGFKIGWPDQFVENADLHLVRIWFGRYLLDVAVSGQGSGVNAGNIVVYNHGGNYAFTPEDAITVDMLSQTTPVPIGESTFNFNVMNTVEVMFNKVTGLVSIWINNAYTGNAILNIGPTNDLGIGMMFAEMCSYSSIQGVFRWPGCYTDVYILDDTGAAPKSRLGKVKVVTRAPIADAAVTWSKPAGAPSNASVAASIPPDMANYLSGVAVGDTDLYSSGAFNFSNETIIATSVVTSGYKTDATGNDLAAVLKIGGTVYEGANVSLPVSSNYETTQSIFTLNPATGLKFTKAELDAANFGMRVKDPVS